METFRDRFVILELVTERWDNPNRMVYAGIEDSEQVALDTSKEMFRRGKDVIVARIIDAKVRDYDHR
jgi:hypothetical protein